MPIFEYKVRRAGEKPNGGTITAESARQARAQLRANGLAIQSIELVHGPRGQEPIVPRTVYLNFGGLLRNFSFSKGGLNGRVSWFIRELATLISVGTPIVDALQLAIDQSRGNFRNLLLDIRERIRMKPKGTEAIVFGT